jgi:predicted RND superfamily exporter protein
MFRTYAIALNTFREAVRDRVLYAVLGFAVLVLSEIRMLRDFGLVTVIDLGVALVGVLIVLPAVLMLAEPGALRRRFDWIDRQLPARRSPS